MARIEKTVFISYRRADVYTALAVYENLKNQGYDVFFDYRSISSGDFEQIITSNIRARAHFILVLTPTALDRCNEPGDWLRREIEIAIDEKRNIVPLFFRGFRFGASSRSGVSKWVRFARPEVLIGKLKDLSRYNGLNVHEDYFEEAMHRLRADYLSKPLDTVLHPVSTEVQRVVRAEQVAADNALEQIEDVKELVKQPEQMPPLKKDLPKPLFSQTLKNETTSRLSVLPWRKMAFIGGGVLAIGLLIWGAANFSQNLSQTPSEPTGTSQPSLTSPVQPSRTALSGQTNTPPASDTSIPPTPTLGMGSTMISDKDGMTLLYVPAGEFTMGSDTGAVDEKPVHKVNLDAFWIDQTEVTVRMYYLCVQAGACKEPTSKRSNTHSSYYGNAEYDNYPVIYVDWNMAKTYCEWADRRLPTEAEWEKAARGDDARTYPWGNDAPNNNLLNYNSAVGDTTKVGTYSQGASPYGALDMAGNVWEWVADWYDFAYYGKSPTFDPPGPISGPFRVLRGGAWNNSDFSVRSALRRWYDPAVTNNDFGFRCASSPQF